MLLNPLDQIAFATFFLVFFADSAFFNCITKEANRFFVAIPFIAAFAGGSVLQAVFHPMVPDERLPSRLILFLLGFLIIRPIAPLIRGLEFYRVSAATLLSTALVWMWLVTIGWLMRTTPTMRW